MVETATSRVRPSRVVLRTSPLGPPNPLPPLVAVPDLHAGIAAPDADEEMRRGLALGHVGSLLPYLTQDDYGRDLVETEHEAVVVENDRLRATFLPGLGGRLWSLRDLGADRELLHSPRTLQLANLALRDAWFAGGVEWNLGTTGHTPLTCAPLHASVVDLDDGTPVLRLHELERLRGLTYQVDAWLPPGSSALVVHVRVTNPHDHDVPVYWWSNTAVPQTASTRVRVPASTAWHFDHTRDLRLVDVSDDVLHPASATHAADWFFDLGGVERPWVAAVDGDGHGLLQTSTRRLRGRKLFVWGTGQGGRRWQEWLSPDGEEYLEIQAGLARTQLEHLLLPAGSSWSWVETYGPVTGDELDAGLEQVLPAAWLEEQVAAIAVAADRAPRAVLATGSGWGVVESVRRDRVGAPSLPPATPVDQATVDDEQRPWLDLLDGHDLDADPAVPPPSYQVGESWEALLRERAGWLPSYLLGVSLAARGEVVAARAAWRSSLRAAENAWSWRALAVTDDDTGAPDDAWDRAVALAPGCVPLRVERLQRTACAAPPDAVLAAVDASPDVVRRHPAVRLIEARAAVDAGHVVRSTLLLETEGLVVPNLREGADDLTELWVDHRALALATAAGEPVSASHRDAARAEPVPARYDFRMHAP